MRAVFAALGANLGIALTKFIAFLFTGSASMLAESVHSVADTGNEVLLLVGRGRSLRPPSDEHPFGFGRERYFYGFVVSVMLFTVGAAFSVYDGIHKILNPETIRAPQVALIVLAASAVLEAFSLRTGVSEANKVRGDRGWGTFIRRTKAPELPVVLLEDLAALIGLGVRVRRGDPGLAHRRRLVGWRGIAGHRPAARDRRGDPGRGDEEPADRRGGQRRGAADDRRRARGRARGGPGHPHADRAYQPGRDPGRGEDRGPSRRHRGPGRGGHRRRGASGPYGRPDRRDDLPGAGHLPPVPGRPDRPVGPRRAARGDDPPRPPREGKHGRTSRSPRRDPAQDPQ